MNPHPQLETSRIKYRFTSSLCPSKIKVFWAIEKQSAPLSAFPRATEETKSKYVHWSRGCKLWPQLRYMRPEYSTQHPTRYLYTKPLMCITIFKQLPTGHNCKAAYSNATSSYIVLSSLTPRSAWRRWSKTHWKRTRHRKKSVFREICKL